MSRNPVILEDTFTVNALNKEGTVYLRVSQIECANEDRTVTAIIDINSEEFPVSLNERLSITIANSLEMSDSVGNAHYDHSVYHRETRLNDCDYAMHGHVYAQEVDESSLDVVVFISCGGLLTKISGKPGSLRDIQYNSDVYILVKRVGK